MQITAIKRGQTLEFSESLDIPDGQAVRIEIIDARINQEKGKFGDNLEEFRRRHNIAELDIDVDAIFLVLVTNNISDYANFNDLQIENWYL